MAFDGKGSIAIMTGKKLDFSQIHLAFAWTYASETRIFDHFVTGKSLSEALIFAEHGENMLCMYINCSECQNQFLHTTCSPHVLSLEFSRIELLILIQWTICCHIVG